MQQKICCGQITFKGKEKQAGKARGKLSYTHTRTTKYSLRFAPVEVCFMIGKILYISLSQFLWEHIFMQT